mgnify:CR=1 FL=1
MFNLKEIISSIADVGQKLFNKSNIKKNDLRTMSKNSLRLVDGNGTQRILKHILLLAK